MAKHARAPHRGPSFQFWPRRGPQAGKSRSKNLSMSMAPGRGGISASRLKFLSSALYASLSRFGVRAVIQGLTTVSLQANCASARFMSLSSRVSSAFSSSYAEGYTIFWDIVSQLAYVHREQAYRLRAIQVLRREYSRDLGRSDPRLGLRKLILLQLAGANRGVCARRSCQWASLQRLRRAHRRIGRARGPIYDNVVYHTQTPG